MRSVVTASFHNSAFSAQATPAWTVDSVRTGVIAKKKGMTSVWTEAGVRLPVTVLQVYLYMGEKTLTFCFGILVFWRIYAFFFFFF